MNAALFNYLSKNRYVLPLFIAGITIATLALTLMPLGKFLPSRIWSYDKVGHLLMFGSWTYLLGLYQIIHKAGKYSLFTIFAIGLSFGIGIELLQYLLPLNRSAEFFDVVSDAIGCFIAVVLLYKSETKQTAE